MNVQTTAERVPVIAMNTRLLTRIDTLHVDPVHQRRAVDALVRLGRDWLAAQPGLVAYCVHHSTDGERVLTYEQWESAEHLSAAEAARPDLAAGAVEATDPHLFDVVYTNDRSLRGATAISPRNESATFINVMHTTPDQQAALIAFVIANDTATFATHPGFRSANFHRSRDGWRVVNYSHWDDERSFLAAINTLFRVPGLTMRQANELAAEAAGERGRTDFRFYEVDAVVVP